MSLRTARSEIADALTVALAGTATVLAAPPDAPRGRLAWLELAGSKVRETTAFTGTLDSTWKVTLTAPPAATAPTATEWLLDALDKALPALYAVAHIDDVSEPYALTDPTTAATFPAAAVTVTNPTDIKEEG